MRDRDRDRERSRSIERQGGGYHDSHYKPKQGGSGGQRDYDGNNGRGRGKPSHYNRHSGGGDMSRPYESNYSSSKDQKFSGGGQNSNEPQDGGANNGNRNFNRDFAAKDDILILLSKNMHTYISKEFERLKTKLQTELKENNIEIQYDYTIPCYQDHILKFNSQNKFLGLKIVSEFLLEEAKKSFDSNNKMLKLCFIIPENVVGFIIGIEGKNINDIRDKTGAKIDVPSPTDDNKKKYREVEISGNPEDIANAAERIYSITKKYFNFHNPKILNRNERDHDRDKDRKRGRDDRDRGRDERDRRDSRDIDRNEGDRDRDRDRDRGREGGFEDRFKGKDYGDGGYKGKDYRERNREAAGGMYNKERNDYHDMRDRERDRDGPQSGYNNRNRDENRGGYRYSNYEKDDHYRGGNYRGGRSDRGGRYRKPYDRDNNNRYMRNRSKSKDSHDKDRDLSNNNERTKKNGNENKNSQEELDDNKNKNEPMQEEVEENQNQTQNLNTTNENAVDTNNINNDTNMKEDNLNNNSNENKENINEKNVNENENCNVNPNSNENVVNSNENAGEEANSSANFLSSKDDGEKICKIVICLSDEEINHLNTYKDNIWINLENLYHCTISKTTKNIDEKDFSLITFNGTPKQNSSALFQLQKYFKNTNTNTNTKTNSDSDKTNQKKE